MNLKHLISLQILAIMSMSAMAELPDEIDVSKYQTIFNDKNNKAMGARNSASKAEKDLQVARDNVDRIESQIRNEVNEKAAKSNEINSLKNQNQDLNRDISQIQNDIQFLLAKQNELANQRTTIINNINALEARSNQLRVERDRVLGQFNEMKQFRNRLATQLNESQKQLEAEQAALNGVIQKMSSMRENKLRIEREKKELIARKNGKSDDEIKRINIQIEQMQQAERELSDQLAPMSAKRTELTQKTADIKGQIATINKQISDRDGEIKDEKKAVDNLQIKIAEVSERKAVMTASLSDLEAARSTMTDAEKQVADKKITNMKNSLAQLDVQLTNAKTSLAIHSEKANVLSAQVEELKKSLSEKNNSLGPIQAELNEVSKVLAEVEPQKNKLRADIANLLASVGGIRSADLEALNQKIKMMDRNAEALDQSIEDMVKSLAIHQNSINGLQRSVQALNQQVNARDMELSRMANAVDARENDLNQNESVRQANIQTLNNVNQQLQELPRAIGQKQETISRNQNTITNNINTINQNIGRIRDIEESIPRLNANLANAKNNESQLAQIADRLDNTADQMESVASEAKNQLNARLALYSQKMVEAKNIGLSQAQTVATQSANVSASNNSNQLGKKLGENSGLEVAKAESFLAGLLRGKSVGYEKGITDGRASKDDYNLGFKNGQIIGLEKAKSEAKLTKFPEGFNAKKLEILSSNEELKQVVIDQGVVASLNNSISSLIKNGAKLVNDEESSESPSVQALQQFLSNDDVTSLAAIIARAKRDLEIANDPQQNDSNPEAVYQDPKISPDVSARNCGIVYKNVADFVAACESVYIDSYIRTYLNQYHLTFVKNYPGSYATAKSNIYNANKTVLLNDGYNKAYPLSFSEGRAVGASEVKNQGVADGTNDGYNNNINSERESQFLAGQNYALQYFKNNGVSRFANNEASGQLVANNPKGLLQGTSAQVELLLKNFGKSAQRSGAVRLKLTALTNNIKLDKTEFALKELPAQSLIDLKNAGSLQISPSALPGEDIRLKATLVFNDELTNVSTIQETILSDIVKINPQADARVEFNANPKWKKWKIWPFSWRYSHHGVHVNIINKTIGMREGIKARLSIVEGQDFVELTSAEATTGVLLNGDQQKVSLSYKYKAKAVNKIIKLKLDLIYAGAVIQSQDIVVKTQKD